MPKGVYQRRYPGWNKGLTKDNDTRIVGLVGKNNPMFGKPAWNKGLTKDTDERILCSSIKQKGKEPGNKGCTKNEFPQLSRVGCNKGCVSPRKGTCLTYETRNLMRESALKTFINGRKSWSKGLTKEIDSRLAEMGKKISVVQKTLWKNPEHAKKVLHRRIPSYPEQMFIDLCKEFKYVGNGALNIGGKNPDFVCINDNHKLIEIWGKHFKEGRNPQDLIDFYKVRGYDCLIIWASELKYSNAVMAKVLKFVGSKIGD